VIVVQIEGDITALGNGHTVFDGTGKILEIVIISSLDLK
jgi:hypothetical protein